MTVAIFIVLWLILFVLFWPLAIAALVLVPLLWLVSIPFRVLFWIIEAALGLVKAILFLPFRVLRMRGNQS